MPPKRYTILCLGDSYTIGESVSEQERFPNQAVELLKGEGFEFEPPVIIAKTGWTTDELAAAITERGITGKFDFATLLIGVNNQYRKRDLDNYREEFKQLLRTAIGYTGGIKQHVVVVSIPDWGVTPFVAQDAAKRTSEQIGVEIDEFNAINMEEAAREKVYYVDITPESRKAKHDSTLTATDGLHPSGKMYTYWAEKVAEKIKQELLL